MSIKISQLGSIVEGGHAYSPIELQGRIVQRKQELETKGCGAGTAVALIHGNEAEFFVNLLALWELGACVVPLSPLSTPSELERMLSHSGAEFAFQDGAWQKRKKEGDAPPRGTALLLYTSGTTGFPKGVLLSFAAVESKVKTLIQELTPFTLARTLCCLPVSFGHGLLGNSLPCLWSGQILYLESAFSSELSSRLGEFIDDKLISFMSSVPALWSSVLPFARAPVKGSLKQVFCASSPLTAERAAEIQGWIGADANLTNVFGITEAASWISALPGKGWNCEFKIADGEILVKAPYLMTGYHRDPEATAACLGEGFFRTGDLGELDSEGDLRIQGRIKEQINRGGQKVSPVEVEEKLLQHPAVAEACVFGVDDEVSGELVAAAVVLKEGISLSKTELREFCRAHLSEFKVPERVVIVDRLPRNSRGKVDKQELRKL